MIAKMCKDATMMGNVWISVLLCLSLAAWQVEGRGGRGGRGGGGGGGAIDDTDVFLIMMLGLVGITCFACCSCFALQDCQENERKRDGETALDKIIDDNILMTPTTSPEEISAEEERLLPRQRIMVQLVEMIGAEMVDMGIPKAELILTTFNKLLSDLTAYVGVQNIQGLLVWSIESGDFIQVFDMDRIPQGSVKVRVVTSGEKTFLRLYKNI